MSRLLGLTTRTLSYLYGGRSLEIEFNRAWRDFAGLVRALPPLSLHPTDVCLTARERRCRHGLSWAWSGAAHGHQALLHECQNEACYLRSDVVVCLGACIRDQIVCCGGPGRNLGWMRARGRGRCLFGASCCGACSRRGESVPAGRERACAARVTHARVWRTLLSCLQGSARASWCAPSSRALGAGSSSSSPRPPPRPSLRVRLPQGQHQAHDPYSLGLDAAHVSHKPTRSACPTAAACPRTHTSFRPRARQCCRQRDASSGAAQTWTTLAWAAAAAWEASRRRSRTSPRCRWRTG
jgi:hypothetical protein